VLSTNKRRPSWGTEPTNVLSPSRAASHSPASVALATGLFALAAGMVFVALLGPLGLGVIRYRYTETMLNQARGLDAFTVAVVAPVAVTAGVLALRRHRRAPLLALGPAGFCLYMLVQYVIGPEYLIVAGNSERFFPLFAALFVLAGYVAVTAWAASADSAPAPNLDRQRAKMLIAFGLAVVLVMYLASGFLSALWDFPSYVGARAVTSVFDEHPTAYWIVAFLDLAVVVPLTVATGLGLLRHRRWAQRAFYGVVG
jgi:hypothetical protein